MSKGVNQDSNYRIRFELLQLARDILSEQQNFQHQTRLGIREDGEAVPQERSKPYTIDDVLKEAETLYTFVQKK